MSPSGATIGSGDATGLDHPAHGDRRQLALGMLDRQLLDPDGRRCGNVDEIELAPTPDGSGVLELTAVLSGPRALRERAHSRVHRWAVGLGGGRLVRVAASELSSTDSAVHVSRRAHELGLGHGDEVVGRWFARFFGRDPGPPLPEPEVVPQADDAVRLSRLLGAHLVDADGTDRGSIRDVVAERRGRVLGEAAGAAWIVTAVLVGHGGLAARLGIDRWARANLLPVDGLLRLESAGGDGGERTVRIERRP
jgi:hypothetical protein